MAKLFKKALVFTDIHFGLKSNSLVHNQDCSQFVDWAIQTAKEHGCETGMFLGDWHHHRASINLQTLNFSLQSLEKLSAAFSQFFFIPGNHDLYYRDKRDIHGAAWAKHLPNIHVCNDWFNEGDVVIAPWLCGDDHKRIHKMKGQYIFGHFELPHFKMNAMVEMPDHGEIQSEHFSNFAEVYSGHFHMRQHKRNINYIGNAFPHNFADAGDDERGCMIIEWGKKPTYHAWPGQPIYRVYQLSEILKHTDTLLKPNMHVRVNLDIDISYEEANFIKETFIGTHSLREITLIPAKATDLVEYEAHGSIEFESVDQIVYGQLSNIESEQFNKNLLLDIYRNL